MPVKHAVFGASDYPFEWVTTTHFGIHYWRLKQVHRFVDPGPDERGMAEQAAYEQMIEEEKRVRNIEAMQTEIGLWHIETFGVDCHNKRLARKLLEEAAEFMCSQSSWATPEAADVLIVLMAWAHRNNVDLLKAVEDKFEIVRERDQKARDNA